jgi:hypothetical protein
MQIKATHFQSSRSYGVSSEMPLFLSGFIAVRRIANIKLTEYFIGGQTIKSYLTTEVFR